MNRAEFMRRLTELLGDVPPSEREEAIQYYNDYFDDAGAENESGVIASLGTPEELARAIKAGLSDGGNGGEFTESGFSGYTQIHRDEMIRTEDAARQSGYSNNYANAGAGGSNGTRTGNAYYQDAYYQRTDGKGVYGGRKDTRKQFNPYEEQGSGAAYASGRQQTPPPKRDMSGGTIALIVILAVLTSPLWIGVLGGLFGTAVGIVAALFGIFLAFLIVGIVFVVVAVALIVTGVVVMFSAPIAGISMIGTALVLFAVGLVCIWLMVLTAAMAIPALIRGIVALGRKLFHRGGAKA